MYSASRPLYLRRLLLCLLLLISGLAAAQTADKAAPPRHLEEARKLVDNLKGVEDNHYGGGKRDIQWEPGHATARSVCSSFMTLLLQHAYGWKSADFKAWMDSTNPEAEAYHDAIVDRHDFKRIVHVSALRPGDILAVKYTDHHISTNGVEDTGHVMLVAEVPQAQKEEKPTVAGTRQYTVTVIDSSTSGHGPTDTRARPGGGFTGGIGRGVFRIYADSEGKIAGYTWSATPKSPYYTAPDRDLVAGRLTRAGAN